MSQKRYKPIEITYRGTRKGEVNWEVHVDERLKLTCSEIVEAIKSQIKKRNEK